MKKTALVILLVLSLVVIAPQAFGGEPKDGMEIVGDVLIARPAGLVSIVLGSVIYVVALPFSIPSGSVDKAGQLLVVDPFKYTFARPLGDFDYKVGTAGKPIPGESQ